MASGSASTCATGGSNTPAPTTPRRAAKWNASTRPSNSSSPNNPPAATVAELQAQVDDFVAYYNHQRPHRAKNRIPPHAAYTGRDKAHPAGPSTTTTGVRVRQDRVDKAGSVTLRHAGRLHHIGVGRDHHRQRVIMLIAGLDIRIITPNGELLRHLTLDPTRDYQPTGRLPGPPKGRPLRTRKQKPPTLPPNRPR